MNGPDGSLQRESNLFGGWLYDILIDGYRFKDAFYRTRSALYVAFFRHGVLAIANVEIQPPSQRSWRMSVAVKG